ncbi:MAG: glycerophosphodiester phosphodiesterase, partial [Chloroflexi bacterium]|nr:glycerophosphodiester phosphodiesterase [Chloroflexota bacterium]
MLKTLFRVSLLVVLVSVFTGTALAARPDVASNVVLQDENDGFLVIAHRGGAGLRPENTMLAYEYAVELGVDVLEMDVHSTADGVLVMLHDDTVDRTTDGTGAVIDLTFEELQELDAAYNFTPDPDAETVEYPYRGTGVTIPTLEAVLEAFPDTTLSIEIKQSEPPIVEPVCEMLREYDRTDTVIIGAFDTDTVDAFREVCPEVPTSGSEGEIRNFIARVMLGAPETYDPIST